MSEARKPLRDLRPCLCGGRPKIERAYGWWHIECRRCHRYPFVRYGCTRVYGWNTRREAVEAWETNAGDEAKMLRDEEERT